MNTKLTLFSAVVLLMGVGLIAILLTTGCGSVYSENVSERPWAESQGPPGVLGAPRRDDRR